MQAVRQIAIVGAGTVGTEIAYAMVLGGDQVLLHDTNARALRLALGRISRRIDRGARLRKVDPWVARRAKRSFNVSTDIKDCAPADAVIEAIRDQQALKQALFQSLDRVVAPDAMLATSSNTLTVTRLAAATRFPDRVVGLHFCYPVYATSLVEIVRSPNTRQDVIDVAAALVRRINKTPLIVPDTPGQVVNRLAQAYFGEALQVLDMGGLDEKTVDRLMEEAGFPMGPFRLMDFLGVDKALEVAHAIYEASFHAAHYRPNPRLQRLVEAGRTGQNSRRGGFYADGEQT
jgi:3-hydroxybutyryl-CoA dehydrogenase